VESFIATSGGKTSYFVLGSGIKGCESIIERRRWLNYYCIRLLAE